MPIALSLLLVLFFLLMNAFFVAAEFSLVRVRKSQVEILVDEGRKGAKYTKLVADNVNASPPSAMPCSRPRRSCGSTASRTPSCGCSTASRTAS